MNTHSQTGTSLAADTVNRIIELDALLGHADQDDRIELGERIAALDPAEFRNILDVFGVKPVFAKRPVEVWVAADEAVKESPANV